MESDFKPTICIDIDGVILTLQEQTQMLALIEKVTPRKLEAAAETMMPNELLDEPEFNEKSSAVLEALEKRIEALEKRAKEEGEE